VAAIAFSKTPDRGWVVAGWAFRQVLDDVVSEYPKDAGMVAELADSRELKGLMVYLLSPDLAARITSEIRVVATGILSGEIRSGIVDQPYGDARAVEQYRDALKELLEAVPPKP
jgi:hypothetical protein